MGLADQPWFGVLNTIASLDASIVAIDYRGYGFSPGNASFENMRVDDSLNFDSIQQASKINKPILVIHGEEDQNVPFSMGQAIFNAATHPGSSFFPVRDGNHCDTFRLVREQFLSRIGQFIAG